MCGGICDAVNVGSEGSCRSDSGEMSRNSSFSVSGETPRPPETIPVRVKRTSSIDLHGPSTFQVVILDL
jgi:hypothetical protein